MQHGAQPIPTQSGGSPYAHSAAGCTRILPLPRCAICRTRIRAHILISKLTILQIRLAETTTEQTWNKIHTELGRAHTVTLTGPAGTITQNTDHRPVGRLGRVGIDEVSYKRGHRYLVVVVDHDTRRLVWAAPGRNKATVSAFFTALGPDRCSLITHVSADGAAFIADMVAELPQSGAVRRPLPRSVVGH